MHLAAKGLKLCKILNLNYKPRTLCTLKFLHWPKSNIKLRKYKNKNANLFTVIHDVIIQRINKLTIIRSYISINIQPIFISKLLI